MCSLPGFLSLSAATSEREPVPPTVDGDGAQDDPGGPLGEVLDEDQGHEGADEDEVGLLQRQGPLPVDADHPHRTKVPDEHSHRRVVHGHVVRLEHLAAAEEQSTCTGSGCFLSGQEVGKCHSPQVHEAEPEEQHEGGQDEPAVDELRPEERRGDQTAPPGGHENQSTAAATFKPCDRF